MKLVDLPACLFLVIHEFFCTNAEDEYAEVYFYKVPKRHEKCPMDTNWKSFLNTTTKFQELKKETVYLCFNKTSSHKYLTDRPFRYFIDHAILNTYRKQLSISISANLPSTAVLKFTGNLHSLHLKDVKFPIPLETLGKSIPVLIVENCSFTDHKAIVLQTKVLVLMRISNSISFENILLKQISKLLLSDVTVDHFHELDHYRSLSYLLVRDCQFPNWKIGKVFDVQNLSTLDTDLFNLDCGILKNFHLMKGKLIVEGASEVEYYFPRFPELKKLTIRRAEISEFNPLDMLVVLSLFHCDMGYVGEMDSSMFPLLEELKIEECRDLRIISLEGDHLTSVSLLGNARNSNTHQILCLRFVEVSSPSLKRVSIENYPVHIPVEFLVHYAVPELLVDNSKVKVVLAPDFRISQL
jgi:hypothetical protein